jgi:hypothetical protein
MRTSTHELQLIHGDIWRLIQELRERVEIGERHGERLEMPYPAVEAAVNCSELRAMADDLEKLTDRLLLLPGIICEEEAPDDTRRVSLPDGREILVDVDDPATDAEIIAALGGQS